MRMVLEAKFKPAILRSMARTKKKQRLQACLRSKMLHRVIIWILLATNSHSMMLGAQFQTSTPLLLPAARDSSQTEMFDWRSRRSTDLLTDQGLHLHPH